MGIRKQSLSNDVAQLNFNQTWFFGLLIFLITSIAFIPLSSRADCIENLVAATDGKSFDEKKTIVDALTKNDMACLFATSVNSPVPPPTFWVPANLSDGVVKYYGKSTATLGTNFEKHMFLFNHGSQADLFGYTVSDIGETLRSPGFVYGDYSQVAEQLVLDYTLDFETMLKDLQKPVGFEAKKIKNASPSNILYGELHDVTRVLSSDLVIGLSQRKQDDGSEKFISYYVLIRK